MINANLQQNESSENVQSENIRHVIELTGEQWLAHWRMLYIGSSMADYLKLSSTAISGANYVLALQPLATVLLMACDRNQEYAKNLAEKWFEVATPLSSVYEQATKVKAPPVI